MACVHVVGSLNADYVVAVERLAMAGETVRGSDLSVFPGGKGANQAVAAARLGALVRMVGMVGADPQGDVLLRSLRRAGVDTRAVGRCERATGSAMIQVLPGGDNAIVVSPGANRMLDPETVRQHLSGIQPGDFLLCQLEVPFETVSEAIQTASAYEAVSVLDPAPASRLPSSLLRMVDILTPNETEASRLLSRAVSDGESAAKDLLALGPSKVVLTAGVHGTWIAGEGISQHIPALAVQAADTTGAGDTFNAGLAVGLLEGRSFFEAARFASAAAAVSVTRPGAQTSCPSRAEAESMLRKYAQGPRGTRRSEAAYPKPVAPTMVS